jgi:hypothetical protein
MRPSAMRGQNRDEHGASAVEFALVVPLLLVLVFGIIDYGLLFSNSLALRQGIREGARQGVVRNFSATACSGTTDLEKLACKTNKQIDVITGTAYTRVVVPNGWAKGEPLRVCSMVKTEGASGLVPFPSGGWMKQQVEMSIEADQTPLPTGLTSYSDTLPSGQNWSWCP